LKVNVLQKAQKDIAKLPKNDLKKVLFAIKNLEKFPEVSNIKKLVNFKPVYRKRIGDYRILFDVEDNQIFVGRVLYRKDSYKG
jgi:mRNA interferase RelE/StbE